MTELLRVNDLVTQFKTESGVVKAVNGVSYYIDEQEIVGLVGESGCGKSVSQLSVMQLINAPGEIVDGGVIFEGQNLLKFRQHGPEMRSIRGAKIAMIFQEPMTSLNPVLTIGKQLTEMLMLHLKMSADVARERAIELMGMVGIPTAENRIDDYPHNFSGGMRQRIGVARALACNPSLIVCDEPIADPFVKETRERIILKGEVPSPLNPPPGCPFHPRCFMAIGECSQAVPPLRTISDGHEVACIRV